MKVIIAASGFSEQITCLVSGTARGVYGLGERYAKETGLPVYKFKAEWKKYGNRAGVLRNIKMAELADALIAVWDGKNRETRHMIRHAKDHGLKVFVFEV